LLFADPLEDDQPDEEVMVLSERQMSRLVFVAAETGARFAREDRTEDPAAWMYARRRLFDNSNAITACVHRTMFARALVLHGVSPMLDMEPSDMDLLLGDSEDVDLDVQVVRDPPQQARASRDASKFKLVRNNILFTATAVEESASGVLHLFYATVAHSEDDVRDQLRSRAGARSAYVADVRPGFDPSHPIAMALVSDATSDLISQIQAAPSSPLSVGFRFFAEHRFFD
jgi:hypothetical protein